MKHLKKIIFSSLFALLVVAGVAFSEYFPDVIVTSPNGIWTDTRAYSTINAAVTAVGASPRDIYIIRSEATTNLTIPSTARLHFFASGSIANSGQLTINTKDIFAGNYQIFTGTGNIDFASGSTVKTGWFSNTETALALTVNDTVTLLVTKSQTLTASFALGNNVSLKWEAPGNILTSNAGVTISNIGQISAGDYQILAGAGNFRFRDGTNLVSTWFSHLRTIVSWVDTNTVNLSVKGTLLVDWSDTVPSNLTFDFNTYRGVLSISGGVTLTVESLIVAGPYPWITGAGSIILPVSAYKQQDWSYWYSTIDSTVLNAAITAIGSEVMNLYLRPGTWTVSTDVTFPSNVKLIPSHGSIFAIATTKTLTISGPLEAGLHQLFSCTGTGKAVYTGRKYPEWWGAKDDSGTTDNTEEIQASLTAGGLTELTSPNGGYYKITDNLNVTVANTRVVGKGKIVQDTADKGVFVITVSGASFDNLELQGPWSLGDAHEANAKAIYAYGSDDANRLSGLKVTYCKIHKFGRSGIDATYVDYLDANHNEVYEIRYAGIIGRQTNYPNASFNKIRDINGPYATLLSVGIAFTNVVNDASLTPKSGIIVGNEIKSIGYQGILLEPGDRFTVAANTITDAYMGICEGTNSTFSLASHYNAFSGNTIINATLDNSADEALSGILAGGTDETAPNVGSSFIGNSVIGYGSSKGGAGTYGAIDLRYSVGLTASGNSTYNSYLAHAKITSVKYSTITGNNFHSLQVAGANSGVLSGGNIATGRGNDYTLFESNTIESGAVAALSVASADKLFIVGSNTYITTAANAINNRLNVLLKHHKDSSETSVATGNLKYITVAQGSMVVNSSIKFRGGGVKTGAGGTKKIDIYWGPSAGGGQTATAHAAAADTNDWYVEGEIIKGVGATQSIAWRGWNGTTMLAGYLAGTQDTDAGDVVLRLVSTCADSGDRVKQRVWIVDREL